MTEPTSGPPTGPKRKREIVQLQDFAKAAGKAHEFHDQARLSLARLILGALLALTVISLAAILWAPDCRLTQAMEFFSFIKAAVPPLVTLVAGFYFGQTSK